MKHAYLILAHNEVEVLSKLVSCLDDARIDIFIHWDAQSGQIPELKTDRAGLFFTDERVAVNWGAFSMVEAEYVLFREASARGPYAYYHLISGVDLPIKTQNQIHDFFDRNEGKEFIGFADASDDEVRYRAHQYFLFSESFKCRNLAKRAIRNAALAFQKFFHIQRNSGLSIKKGSQWCSLTHSFVQYVLDNRDYVSEIFHDTFCPDEMYIQTLCFNSDYYHRVYDTKSEFNGNKRYIKWVDGELCRLEESDLNDMLGSDRMFARKFSSDNMDLIDKLINFVE